MHISATQGYYSLVGDLQRTKYVAAEHILLAIQETTKGTDLHLRLSQGAI